MNVIEAMAEVNEYQKARERDLPPGMRYREIVAITLAKEVERLRAELAAAKAASVCPVKVLNIFEGTYESDRYIELRTDVEADTFTDWLRERMKERGE